MSDDTIGIVIDLEKAKLELQGGIGLELKYEPQGCMHRQKVVIPDRRAVECKKCDAEFDPFEVLLGFVREWERYRLALTSVKENVKLTHERLADLKRQERNARARLKRVRGQLEDLRAEMEGA